MRWFLHLAGVILLVIAALLAEWPAHGSTLADALALGLAGIACWCASDLKAPPAA